ncbi:lytic murein transglycosylase [Streptomyces sp. enrichment culture]|uniref:lytic transglycosylase domain-containing protein n=1 Tax=Streptomyces sp. enrichment culture TaxID=1795815 RepID=UPI003F5766A1
MPVRRARGPRTGRTRRGLRTTAVTVAAMAALTASQAPGLLGGPGVARAVPPADDARGTAPDGPYTEPAPPGDDSFHVELPPLDTADSASAAPPVVRALRARSGIPATVLRAYRAAETSVARTDPGCRLPWQLLAAIGKVESGQARGGAVDRAGTTLGRITGPPLDGRGFALIRDTDGGAHDGDTVYDRAVGPMQFLPSTWARWGTDGNGDGRADPNNIFDAALAAGHYLCAGDRNLARAADLDRAVLSYNRSGAYLRLVRQWLEFYLGGVHAVADGRGIVPRSPGAGGDTPATEPVGGGGSGGRGDGGGGIVIGPDPSAPGTPGPSPKPSSPGPEPSPSSPPGPSASPTGQEPSESPSEPPAESPSEPPAESPTGTPSPSPDPTGPSPSPTSPDDCPTGTAPPSSGPTDSPAGSPCPDPDPSSSPTG